MRRQRSKNPAFAAGEESEDVDTLGGLVRTSKWLPAVNLTLAGLACIAALPLVLLQDALQFRTAAALAPAIAAWGALCLAQLQRKEVLQLTSLLMAGLSAVYLGWAQIDPDIETSWGMAYVFRLLMVLAALTFLYGLALPRWLLTETGVGYRFVDYTRDR